MVQQTDDIAAIQQLAEEWHAGWVAGDAEALLALYAAEPVLMPQSQPAVMGKAAIHSLYESIFDEFTIDGTSEFIEVEVNGDWGYFWSTYQLTATPKAGGAPITDEGKSIFIVKRQADGPWRITRLIANSDWESAGG